MPLAGLTSVPSTGAGALPPKCVTMIPALIPEMAGPWMWAAVTALDMPKTRM